MRHTAAFVNLGIIAEPPQQRNPRRFTQDGIRPHWECAVEKGKRRVFFVPFEVTEQSIQAARKVVNALRHSSVRFVLFHAVHLNLTPYGPANPAWLKAALRQEAVEMAEPVMRLAQASGLSAICVVEEGEPTHALVKAVVKWEADVIVLTTQQRGRMHRWFERRTLGRLIRSVACPVMVIDAVPRI